MIGFFIPFLALTGATAGPAGVPTTWTPEKRVLARIPASDTSDKPDWSDTYELLRVGNEQQPVDFGLEWPELQELGSLTIDFASLGGKVYEPEHDGARVEVRQEGGWRAIPAALEIDYAGIGRLAALQQRGTSRWAYRFEPVRSSAIRVYVPPPAGGDPGYRCIAISALKGGPPDGRAIGPGVAIRGNPPAIPGWLEPGANLAVPEASATVRRGSPTIIRWPRPVLVNRVEAPGAAGVEFLAAGAWRPVQGIAVCEPGTIRFLPIAMEGLRIRFAGSPAPRVSVQLDSAAPAYFDSVRRSGTDQLGERFRALPRRDLAAMESLLLPIDFSKVAIGRPADLQETMVSWTGTFFLTEQSACVDPNTGAKLPIQSVDRWFAPAVGDAREPFGADWMRLRSRYLDGWRPAVVTTCESGGALFEQTIFVTAPGSGPYGTVARVTVTNRARRRIETAFTYAMGRRRMYSGSGEHWTPFLSDPQPTGYTLDSDGRTVRNVAGEIVFSSLQPGRWEGTRRENHYVVPLTLAPGESRTLDYFVPSVTEPVRDAGVLHGLDPGKALAASRAYWDGFLNGAAVLDLPEAPLNDLYRNLLAQCAIIGLDGDQARYGAYAYEAYFGVEEGWPAVALAQYGLSDYARRMMDYMLSPQALDKGNYHHQYRNGLAPWYAIQVSRLTGDRAWLKGIASTLRQCADWTISTTTANSDPRYGGILPRHVYGGDISMPAYSLYSNAACWRGLHDTALAFEVLGDQALAQRYREAAASYHRRLMDLADSLVDRSSDVPFLPMAFGLGEGATAREKEPAYPVLASESPSSDTWAYVANYWNLFAPLLMELRPFVLGDPRATWIPRYMEQHGGVLTGQARFSLGYDCIYGKGYIESLLEQGRREEFLTSLYGLLANGMSRNLYSSPEVSGVFPLRTDNRALRREHDRERWNWLYRPVGGWIAGWQNQEGEPLAAGPGMALQLLRMALVREDFGSDPPTTLRILDGAPAHWFESGKRIVVRGLRTFFGPVSFEVRRSRSAAHAVIDCAGVSRPERIILRLPDPNGRPIRSVKVQGAEVGGYSRDEITIARPTGHIELDARY